MAALLFSITDAGRAALRNAQGDGTNAVRIAYATVTASAFPSGQPVPDEIKRIASIAGGATAADTIHVTISDASKDVYSVRGFGFYLADGTLFASYGQADVIVEKSAGAVMLLACDVQFASVSASQITFGDTTFVNPAATTDTLGVVKLASDDEAKAGRDAQKALTSTNLLAALNTRLGNGAPTDYAKRLLAIATNADFLNTIGPTFPPSKHTHAMDDVVGLVAALAAKLDARVRYVPGQIIVTAGQQAPPYTLLCNGAAISRTQYADLFAAIGTTYGAGDGVTTFNVPRLGEGTVIKATLDASKVGTYSAGALLTHTHGASAATAGDHAHTVTLTAGGSHSHGASASGVGDHAHGAWTDGQGNHAHSGSTDAQGQHSHVTLNNLFGDGSGSSYVGGGGPAFRSTQRQTNDAGNHAHNFGTDWQGNHGHNIGMNGAGAHSHTISIAAVGDHGHSATLANGGSHSHTLTIAAAGGSDNLAAGTHMFHFIAY
ncbi:tail fiber protein [Dyella sp.]|uniref:tail fiber protein n=1 Tax=Dyella sp. TaxID=1869338 RepID=UPI002B47C289|nr:tail fiber protein [Dyella sp.]HKT28806.1 tail fiber protein [Dyella sp.]